MNEVEAVALLAEGGVVVVLVLHVHAHPSVVQALAAVLNGHEDVVEGTLLAVQGPHRRQIAGLRVDVEEPAVLLRKDEEVQLAKAAPVRIARGDLRREVDGSGWGAEMVTYESSASRSKVSAWQYRRRAHFA